MIDHLIVNGTVVTVNASRDVIDQGAVAIEGTDIVGVGPTDELADRYDASNVRDVSGSYVVPGFINTHVHVPDILARGIGKERALHDWLFNVKRPFVAAMDENDHATAAALYSWESLQAGITTFVENAGGIGAGYTRDIVSAKLDVYRDAGLRNVYAHGFVDQPATGEFGSYLDSQMAQHPEINHPPGPDVETGEQLAYTVDLIEEFHGTADGRQYVWPAPYLARSASVEALQGAVEIAQQYDVMTTTHTAEAVVQEEQSPGSSIEHLSNVGYLGPRTLLGHCVHLSERDIRLLATTDTKVVHNVVANLSLGSGVSPVPRMAESEVVLSLGTDNACQNDLINILSDMRLATLVHKGHRRDPGAMTAERVLEMATIDAAKAIGESDRLGSLESGKRADIAVVDGDGIHGTPATNAANALVHQTTGGEITTVFCNGEIVLSEGTVPGVEGTYPDLRETATATARDIRVRAGLSELADRSWTRRADH